MSSSEDILYDLSMVESTGDHTPVTTPVKQLFAEEDPGEGVEHDEAGVRLEDQFVSDYGADVLPEDDYENNVDENDAGQEGGVGADASGIFLDPDSLASSSASSPRTSRRKKAALAAVALMAVVLVIALSVGLTNKNRNNSPADSQVSAAMMGATGAADDDETDTPTYSPSTWMPTSSPVKYVSNDFFRHRRLRSP